MPDNVDAPRNRSRRAISALTEVTPATLKRARRSAESGEPADLFAVLEYFHKMDEEIGPALRSLLSAALKDTVRWVAADETDEALRQQEVCEEIFGALDWEALLWALTHAHYKPAVAAELVWDAYSSDGRTYQAPVTYEVLPDWWVYADKAGTKHREIWVGNAPLQSYAPGSLIVATSDKVPSYQDVDWTRYGCGLATLRFGIYSWFNWGDWAAYNEALAIPTVLGTLLEGYTKDDEDKLKAAVFGLSSDSRAIKTERTNLELLERKDDSTPLFDTFGDKAGRARSLIVKGESLTEGPRGQVGSYAASRTSNGVRVDVAQTVLDRMLAVVFRRAVRPFLHLNFARPLVGLVGHVSAAANQSEEVKIDEFLLRNGVELSMAELRERYGRSAPTEDDDRVTGRMPFDPFAGA